MSSVPRAALAVPTAALPGSPEKVAVLAARAAEAEVLLLKGTLPPGLFHARDAGMPEAPGQDGAGPAEGAPPGQEQPPPPRPPVPHGNVRHEGTGVSPHADRAGRITLRATVRWGRHGGKARRYFPVDETGLAAAERWVRDMRARRDRGEPPPGRNGG